MYSFRHTAPFVLQRPITVNMGMSMPGWFDIYELGNTAMSRKEDTEGIQDASRCASAITQRSGSADLCHCAAWTARGNS